MSSQSLEPVLTLWSKGPDTAEEARIQSTIKTIKNAVQPAFDSSGVTIRIKEHGSHYNRVNVRKDSDIDVGVICTSTFFSDVPEGMTKADFGIRVSNYEYAEFKRTVQQSLKDEFGASAVKAGNKSFKLRSRPYEINADIVPFFEYRRYDENGGYIEGVELRPNNNPDKRVYNWPEQHYENGVVKHAQTNRRYKKLVRILKKLQHQMENEKALEAIGIPGFLCECLVWNVPDRIFGSNGLTVDLLGILSYLDTTLGTPSFNKFREVSEKKWLFGEHNRQQAYAFIRAASARISGL